MRVLSILLTILMLLGVSAHAAEISGVVFSDTHQAGEEKLTLVGTGMIRYLVFMKAYVAAFYMEEEAVPEDALSDTARRLEIEYFVPIEAKDFVYSTNELIARNVDADMLARLGPKIEQINSLYEDVKPGDRYSLTYTPGLGTELALNGKPKGTIEGMDFAAAVFSIWLGPRPISETLKAGLLNHE